MTLRLGILISGGGRTAINLDAFCRAPANSALDAHVAIVITHRMDGEGVQRCRDSGVRVASVPLGHDVDTRIDAVLDAARVDLVCLAGYLRKFRVGTRWADRCLNIHPGLLPQFGGQGMYGLHVHRAVIAAGVQESGCTVHEVDEDYDHGAFVLERRCAVHRDDTAHTLAARVFDEECIAYPQAIAIMAARLASTQLARAT